MDPTFIILDEYERRKIIIKEKNTQDPTIGIIGFGEVGQTIVKGLLKNDKNVIVYDTRFMNNKDFIPKDMHHLDIHPVNQLEKLSEKCDIIFSLVPSTVSNLVANKFADSIRKGTFFLDLTTSSPEVKKKSALIIHSAGGIYGDISIMGTVATENYQVPLIIAGENCEEVKIILDNLGMNSKVISKNVGDAASIKMLRSIFMKGIEALLFETMLVAEKYNVRKEVTESISNTMKNNDFEKLIDTLITTHMKHRERRYKEVQESISLVRDADIVPYVTEGVLHFFSNSVQKNKTNLPLPDNVEEILQHELKNKTL